MSIVGNRRWMHCSTPSSESTKFFGSYLFEKGDEAKEWYQSRAALMAKAEALEAAEEPMIM